MLLKKIMTKLNIFTTMPIVKKITLWYTAFIVIFVSIILSGLFFIANKIEDKVDKKEIIETVREVSLGKEKYKTVEDGVTLVLYDENNNVIAGEVPKNFTEKIERLNEVKEYKIEDKKYIYYDTTIQLKNYSNVKYIRGIAKVSKNNLSPLVLGVVVLFAIFLIVAIAYGGYKIINISFKPVREISKTAKKIAQKGDLTERIPIPKNKDELYELTIVINEMLGSLENSSKREKKFSSDVSHELRTPVSVIRAESDYGLKYADSVEEAKESFEVIERQSKRMSLMINQILELARLEQEDYKIEKNEINLSNLLLSTMDDNKKLLANKNIKLEKLIASDIIISANELLVHRVLDNLLSNAVKFAKEQITVKLEKNNEEILLFVEDDGIGILDEEKEKIWNRFYKVDSSRTNDDTSSSGLGLSLVKKIIELHNWQIWIEDSSLGGAKFIIKIEKEKNF